MSSKLCPECGASVHRSHARGLTERLIRVVSSYRAYRCHECGWRGWFGNRHTSLIKTRLRTIVSVLLTLLITTLLALYLIDKMTAPATPVQMQQTTP